MLHDCAMGPLLAAGTHTVTPIKFEHLGFGWELFCASATFGAHNFWQKKHGKTKDRLYAYCKTQHDKAMPMGE